MGLLDDLGQASPQVEELAETRQKLANIMQPIRRDIYTAINASLVATRGQDNPARRKIVDWKDAHDPVQADRFSSYLYSQSPESALNVPEIKPAFSEKSPPLCIISLQAFPPRYAPRKFEKLSSQENALGYSEKIPVHL